MSFLGKKFTRQQWTHMFFYSLQAPLGFLAGYFGRDNLPLFIGIVVFWVINSFQVQALFWHAINKRPRSGSPDFLKREQFETDTMTSMQRRMDLSRKKGKDYASTEDIAANFKRVADIARVTRVQQLMDKPYGYALFMVLMKIDRFINLELGHNPPQNEAVVDTWDDAKNYLDFAEATWKEAHETPKPDTLVKTRVEVPPDLFLMLTDPIVSADTLRKGSVRLTLDDVPHCPWCGAPCPYCEYGTEMAGDLSKDTKLIELPEQTEITAGLIADYETLAELVNVWKQQALSPELNESQKGQLYKRILSATRARTDIGAILLARGVKAAPKEKDVAQLIAHAKEVKAAREKAKNASNAQGTP